MTEKRTDASRTDAAAQTGDDGASVVGEHAPEPSVDGRLGRYVVLESVGRGAMGHVLRAYDPKLQREVALKVVLSLALDARTRARTLREARAMAKLSHPNVVAVYDAEDSLAGVVLVMEYVRGQTLGRWVRAAARPWSEIVERFLAAGRGLAAAHAQGLLHRDFKADNVLVAESGAVKVTDFGLAKMNLPADSVGSDERFALVQRGDADDALTQADSVVGTPRYMAPEQHCGEPLSPAADQYAYCVALWEALARDPPFVSENLDDLAAIKQRGPPAWPTGGSTVPRPIVDALRRGLSPAPGDRWPSMDALVSALAYDPSIRRRRWLFGLGSVAALGLGVVTLLVWADAHAQQCTGGRAQLQGVWDDARREAVQRSIASTGVAYAAGVWTRIAARLDEYADGWVAMHQEACRATTIRGEQSVELMELRMACLHRAKTELSAAVDVLEAADPTVVRKAHVVVGGLARLSRCADAEALRAQVEPPSSEDTAAVERMRLELAAASAASKAGKYPQAEAALERAQADMHAVTYPPITIDLELERGFLLDRMGQYEQAVVALRKVVRLGAAQGQWRPVQRAATYLLFVIGSRLRRPDEALGYRELARGLARGNARAEADVHDHLGNILSARGEYTAAEAEHRKALALRESSEHPDEADIPISLTGLGGALSAQGRHAEAEVQHRRALEHWTRTLGADHPDVAVARNSLGSSLRAQGRYDEAVAEYREVIDSWKAALGPDHPHLAASHNNLATVLRDQGKPAQAAVEYRKALKILEAALGADHPDVILIRGNLAGPLFDLGEYEEAEALLRESLAQRVETLGDDHPAVATSRSALGELLFQRGRADEALPLAEQAWARRQRDDVPPEMRAATAFVLARALWAESEREQTTRTQRKELRARARALAHEALAGYTAAGDASADEHDEVDSWITQHERSKTR